MTNLFLSKIYFYYKILKEKVRMIKKVLVLLMIFLLVSCSHNSSQQKSDLLASIKEKGEIVVAMEGSWSPWTFHDASGNLVGYDVEVANLIAQKLGVKAKFVESEWDSLLAGLESGRFDIIVNGVGVTFERKAKFSFSKPYAYNKTAIIVRADDDRIKSMVDLSKKKTANTISSTYASLAQGYNAEVIGVDDFNQTIELLLSNRVDATLNAEVAFFDYIKSKPNAKVKIAGYDQNVENVAIPMRKAEETKTLKEAIDQALEQLQLEGELSKLSNKYFGIDISKK